MGESGKKQRKNTQSLHIGIMIRLGTLPHCLSLVHGRFCHLRSLGTKAATRFSSTPPVTLATSLRPGILTHSLPLTHRSLSLSGQGEASRETKRKRITFRTEIFIYGWAGPSCLFLVCPRLYSFLVFITGKTREGGKKGLPPLVLFKGTVNQGSTRKAACYLVN